MKKQGKLYVISAPSGAGKTTLIKDVLNRFKTLSYSVSHTTRKPRENERHGVDYFFITPQEFKEKIENRQLLEWAKVHDNYYGTSRDFITSNLDRGKSLILDIDVQGAQQIMESDIDIVTIFIMPPSISVLSKRLKRRGTDNKKVIATRIRNAKAEIARKDLYQYVVVNDDLERAKEELGIIFTKEMN